MYICRLVVEERRSVAVVLVSEVYYTFLAFTLQVSNLFFSHHATGKRGIGIIRQSLLSQLGPLGEREFHCSFMDRVEILFKMKI